MSKTFAFPQPTQGCYGGQCGMTLRDYFAAAALSAAYAALDRAIDDTDIVDPASVAIIAYEVADAMLAEREKGGTA